MRRFFLDFGLVSVVVLGAGFIFAGTPCRSQTLHRPSSKQADSLKRFLQGYHPPEPDSKERGATRYSSAFVDLRDDGMQEVIVYLTGAWWCGSGGCSTLVLAPDGSSYKVITKITITRLPIRVLKAKSNGWHDLGVMVRVWYGEGDVYAREAELSFDGRSYPSNPSIPPARMLSKRVEGEVVILSTTEGSPLY